MSNLKTKIKDQVKAAMKAKEMTRLGVLRQITAAIKQVEIDTREELDENGVLSLLEKMKKQRLDSIAQFNSASRADLAEKEISELAIVEEFLPEPLDQSELDKIIAEAISSVQAQKVSDMGKVMAVIKPQILGRASMKDVGDKIKSQLSD